MGSRCSDKVLKKKCTITPRADNPLWSHHLHGPGLPFPRWERLSAPSPREVCGLAATSARGTAFGRRFPAGWKGRAARRGCTEGLRGGAAWRDSQNVEGRCLRQDFRVLPRLSPFPGSDEVTLGSCAQLRRRRPSRRAGSARSSPSALTPGDSFFWSSSGNRHLSAEDPISPEPHPHVQDPLLGSSCVQASTAPGQAPDPPQAPPLFGTRVAGAPRVVLMLAPSHSSGGPVSPADRTLRT